MGDKVAARAGRDVIHLNARGTMMTPTSTVERSDSICEMRLQSSLRCGMVFYAPACLAMRVSEGGADDQTWMLLCLRDMSSELSIGLKGRSGHRWCEYKVRSVQPGGSEHAERWGGDGRPLDWKAARSVERGAIRR